MNINNIYYEQLTDENWHDARAVYAFLPKLDDDEIKPLIKSDDEINTRTLSPMVTGIRLMLLKRFSERNS